MRWIVAHERCSGVVAKESRFLATLEMTVGGACVGGGGVNGGSVKLVGERAGRGGRRSREATKWRCNEKARNLSRAVPVLGVGTTPPPVFA